MCVCCVLVCFPFLSISLPHGICDVSCHSQRYFYYKLYVGDNPKSFNGFVAPQSIIGEFRQAVFERHPKALKDTDVDRLEARDIFTHIFISLFSLLGFFGWHSPLILCFFVLLRCALFQVYPPGTTFDNGVPNSGPLNIKDSIPMPADPKADFVVVAPKLNPKPEPAQQGQKFIH
jgi:hypothetical protein